MSLRIWLPLIRDTLNYGVEVSNVTETNVTINANGKIGACYSFNGSSSSLIGTQSTISNNTNEWSFACWLKLNTTTAGQTLFSCRTGVNQNGFTIIYYGTSWIIDDGARWQPSASLSTNTWYHICVVRKKGVGKFIYINGELNNSTTTTGTPTATSSTNYSVGASQNTSTTVSGNWLNGYLNDVRFYDHAISMAEIHELSKGLILHYKLEDFQSTDNLIVNGFGELGTENWTSTSAISTTEIPPNHSEIKASFYGGNMTKEYIPISKSHTYTISGYIKATSGATGTTYPSIYPYDADKLMITNQQSRAGFDLNTSTTLREPLKNGDTVIYATDLSKWRVDTTTHYYFAAVFGYKNSFGYTYDDFVYTRDSLSFGSQTDKTNIDKTNNTITLKAAFTGRDRPAGTAICQAAAGSTYFYPWNGIAVTSIADWVFKTATINPSTTTRLMAAAYWRWSTYGRCYIAGNKLVDNFAHDTTVVDSSGYGNHGTRNGNMSTSYTTPRHDICTVFDGSTTYIDIVSGIFPVVLNGPFTISMWIYNADTGDRSILFGNYGLTGSFFNIEKTINENVRFYWSASPDKTFSNSVLTSNAFTHLAITRDGNTVKSYINGILKDTSTTTLTGNIPTTANNFRIGADSRTGATRFKGRISDFRIYSTTLNAEDVLALYNVGASVANNGSMMAYQFKEE